MLLGYLTEESYEKLLHDIDSNAEKYLSDEDWVAEYFGSQEWFKMSRTVSVNDFTPHFTNGDISDEQKSQEDLINVRMMYEAFRGLTPLQASNKYMWTYLCHAVPKYREYIKARWMGSDRSNTIRARYFVTGSGSLLNDNALSRLWWYGHLTYDPDKSNHYALTEILLTNQTICTDVMDTLNRTNFTRIKGVLMAIRDFKEILGGTTGLIGYFRECNKYLNHYAAVTNFDFLDSEDIRKLALDYMVGLKETSDKKKSNLL